MKKSVKLLIWIIAALLAVGVAVFVCVGYIVPYCNALTHFSETSPLVFEQQSDGSVLIKWPEALDTDHYLVEISLPLREGQEEATAEFSQYLQGNSVTVPALSGERTVTVYTVGEYYWPFSKTPRLRVSKDAICVSDDLTPSEVKSFTWSVNEVTDTARAELQTDEGLRLGDTKQQAETLYGTDYTEEFGQMIYTRDKTQLILILENDAVISIEYRMVTE